MYIFVGLGNPGKEYELTRHNAGRIVLEGMLSKMVEEKVVPWVADKKTQALIYKMPKQKIVAVLPETFMNKSGLSVKKFVGSKKAAEKLVVFYDDLDLPFGTVRLAWDKSAGGHKGLASVIKAVGTQEFLRVRIGISPAAASGRAKKPIGEEKVLKLILGKFKPEELKVLKKHATFALEAIECFMEDGHEKAMSIYNARG